MKNFFKIALIFTAAIINQSKIIAQGCVAVRSMGGITPMNSGVSYNLKKGDFQIGANYRYFHSWRHFVGDVEQPQRQLTGGGHGPDGKDRGNAVNIYSHAVDLNLSYGLTNRLQVNISIPYVNNERSQILRKTKTATQAADTSRYSVYAQGLGDVRASLNYWLVDPAKMTKSNLMIGLGVKLATGSHSVMDDAPQSDGTTAKVVMDQAIQPGDGGVGLSLELSGFKQIHRNTYAFANGYYLFNPRRSNGTFKSAVKTVTGGDGVKTILTGYNEYASPDQYFARIGVMTSVGKSKNLTLSLAARGEGIPAYDAIGDQNAYRRPGYTLAIEPGVTYRKGAHTFSLFVPYNYYKNRIQSAADRYEENLLNKGITDQAKLKIVHGDAAFADYSISLSYSFRFSKKVKLPTLGMKK